MILGTSDTDCYNSSRDLPNQDDYIQEQVIAICMNGLIFTTAGLIQVCDDT